MTNDTQVFRPSRKAFFRYFLIALPAALPFIFLPIIVTRGGLLGVLIAAVAGFGIGSLIALWYLKRSRIEIDDREVRYRGFFSTKRFQLGNDFMGMLVSYQSTPIKSSRSLSLLTWFLYNKKTGKRLRIYGMYYSEEALVKMAELTGSDIKRDELLDTQSLAPLHPELLSWQERHPAWLIIFTVIGTLAGIALIGVIVSVVYYSTR